MADLQAIRDELDADPLTRGYSGMTDQQASDDLNLTIYGAFVDLTLATFLGIVSTSWPSNQDDRDYLSVAASVGSLPTKEEDVRDKLTGSPGGIFSGPAKTALDAAMGTLESRADVLSLGKVQPGTVQNARAL